jgi:hypothetical protein
MTQFTIILGLFFIALAIFTYGGFVYFVSYTLHIDQEKARQACLSNSGFPISKGSMSAEYYCFKQNSLIDSQH